MTTTTSSPTNSAIARTMKEGASPRQQSAIISIAKAMGLNGHRVCEQVNKCEIHELTGRAASQLIDLLESGRAGEMAKEIARRNAQEFQNYLSQGGAAYNSQAEWDAAI